MRKILPSVTTHQMTKSSWRDKIGEIQQLELNSIGLFLTGLSPESRKECYRRLLDVKRTHDFDIPFVHAVSNMTEPEYRFLVDTFGTRSFNLHPTREFPLEHKLSPELRALIYIENSTTSKALQKSDLEGFAGVCLDISHLEESRLGYQEAYLETVPVLNQNSIGANHISAAWSKGETIGGRTIYSRHVARSGADFAYLASYPKSYLSNLCALELENSLAEQKSFIQAIRKFIERAARNVQCPAAEPAEILEAA